MNNDNDLQTVVADGDIPTTPQEDSPQNNNFDRPPHPVRRRQHYFDNMPPKPAPALFEQTTEELPEEENASSGSGKAAMAIAVSIAAVLAVAVIAFLVYIFIAHKESEEAAKATAPSTTTTEATLATEDQTETVVEKIVYMPELLGLKEAEAYKLLNEADVRYKVTRVYSADVPFNCVVSQYPEAYSSFPRSDEAIVYLSKGKENEIIQSTTRVPSAKTTQPASTAPGTTLNTGDYLLPESASRQLTRSDLTRFGRDALNLALNEIYARHGRKFSDPTINEYFRSKSWYNPTIAAKDFDDSILNQYEIYNVKLITNYQSEMGWR